MTRQTVSIDGDFDVRVLGATSRMANRDFSIRLTSFLHLLRYCIFAATFCWRRDDVAGVICVPSQAVSIDGDFHVRVGVATCGVANLDSFIVANHFFTYVGRHLLRATFCRCGDDVIGMVAMTVQPVHVDGDFNERVRGTVCRMTDRDSTVVLLLLDLRNFLQSLSAATACRRGDDVPLVVSVPSEAVNVDGDLNVGV